MANHLIFEFNATRYAIAAEAVRTVFWLPELSPVEDLPPWFVGLINRHGEVLPIVDLGLRFGHPANPYRLDQAVILLEDNGCRVGLVVDQAQDLVDIGPDAAAPYVQLADSPHGSAASVIAGTLKWQDRVLILLDAAALLRLVMQLPAQSAASTASADRFTQLSPADLTRLRQRTATLARLGEQPEPTDQAYALVRIGAGRYAIALQWVAEFTHLGAYTPIPCCPPHIMGCVNLRGAILTVLDLAPRLHGSSCGDYQDLVVLRHGDQRLGLAVNQVIDIHAAAARALTALTGPADGHPHCKWLLHEEGGPTGVLDVEALLQPGVIEVNEQV